MVNMNLNVLRRDMPIGLDVQHGDEKRPIFYGHAATGSAFIIAAIFWMIRFSWNVKDHNDGDDDDDNDDVTNRKRHHGIVVFLRKVPFEGCYWITTGLFALLQIFSVPYFRLNIIDEDGEFSVDSLQGWQHVALGLPFAIHGGTRILAGTCYSSLKCWVEPTGIIACGLFSLISFLHGYARDPLDAHIHFILGSVTLSTVLFYTAEYFSHDSWHKKRWFFPKTFSMLLQGTWMFQAAFILDPQNGVTWDRDSFVNVMGTSTIFVGHIIIDMSILLLIYLLVKLAFKLAEHFSSIDYWKLSADEVVKEALLDC